MAPPTPQASPVSRRSFLTASTLAAGAVALGGKALLRAAEPAKAELPSASLRVAMVGVGGQGRVDMLDVIGAGATIVALCDVDERMIAQARNVGGESVAHAKTHGDYRDLLHDAGSFDAVLIATPDHWHAPLCRAFMRAGKHVYCEKPLTHSLAEARDLRELSRTSGVVTQMGNHGSASKSMRRATELVKAGAIGQVRDIHVWLEAGLFPMGTQRPPGEDVVPAGFDWEFWVGPSPLRPFKAHVYHPSAWRGWYDFGSGQIGDFGCHCLNMPLRALDLTYPDKIEVLTPGSSGECYAKINRLRLHFPARGSLDGLTVHWYDGGPTPPDDVIKDVTARFKKPQVHGVILVGDKGVLYTNPWNIDCLIKLNGEAELIDVTRHPATKDIPQTLPRVKNHQVEWVAACLGGPKTFSDFEIGGHLTEIALAGVVALRVGRTIDWDGEAMRAPGAPEADKFVRPTFRKEWLG